MAEPPEEAWAAAAADDIEPEPTKLLPRELEPPHDDGDADVVPPQKPRAGVPPIILKVLLSLSTCGIFMLIYLVSYFAMDPGGLASCSGSVDTQIKIGSIFGMQDRSANPCTDYYAYACGSYIQEHRDTSVFLETQLRLVRESISQRGRSWSALQTSLDEAGVASDATLAMAGIYGCVDVDITADIHDRSKLALYLSAPCSNCLPARHPVAPVIVTGVPSDLPSELVATINTVKASGAHVYWLPLNSSYTSFPTFRCWHSAADMWTTYISNLSTFHMANTLYAMDVLDPVPDISGLVTKVRSALVRYIHHARFVRTSGAKAAYIQRAESIPVLVGATPNTIVPRCVVGTPLIECLTTRWASMLNAILVKTSITPSGMWSGSNLEVNAYYNPMVDAVYIPGGILQMPFFSTDWPEWIQMATVGRTIGHEIGHALRPEWSFPIDQAPEDVAAVYWFQSHISRDLQVEGVTQQRAYITASENWADKLSIEMNMRYAAQYKAQTVRDSILVGSQVFCDAGDPCFQPNSTDPHSTSCMRVNGTVIGLLRFYQLYNCPLKPNLIF